MDNQSIQHTRWNCTYHIVFIPKYRKKVIFNDVRRDLGQILRKLCEDEGSYDSLGSDTTGSCAYVGVHTRETERIGLYGLLEGKEHFNAV